MDFVIRSILLNSSSFSSIRSWVDLVIAASLLTWISMSFLIAIIFLIYIFSLSLIDSFNFDYSKNLRATSTLMRCDWSSVYYLVSSIFPSWVTLNSFSSVMHSPIKPLFSSCMTLQTSSTCWWTSCFPSCISYLVLCARPTNRWSNSDSISSEYCFLKSSRSCKSTRESMLTNCIPLAAIGSNGIYSSPHIVKSSWSS